MSLLLRGRSAPGPAPEGEAGGEAPASTEAPTRSASHLRRGLGHIYQPTYRDPKTRALKKSAIWWIRYSFRGKKFTESSDSRNRNDAVKLLKKRLGEMSQGKVIGPSAEKVTFEDLAKALIADYERNGRKSLKAVNAYLKRLREAFGFFRAVDITSDRIDRYIADQLAARVAPATVQNQLAVLKPSPLAKS